MNDIGKGMAEKDVGGSGYVMTLSLNGMDGERWKIARSMQRKMSQNLEPILWGKIDGHSPNERHVLCTGLGAHANVAASVSECIMEQLLGLFFTYLTMV